MSRARDFADLASAYSGGALGKRNMIRNGDMAVAQRGTSSTSTGYKTIDRFTAGWGTVSITQTQQSLTTGSPYDLGFRKFYRLTNTSTSSAAGVYIQAGQYLEAQDIASSGWNFKSSSSFMTVSYWARSSLAGTYYTRINTTDGTVYYRIKAFTLEANTWTKVSFTFEGNSNLTIDDNANTGLTILTIPHYGTTFTGSNASTSAWFTLTSNDYFPDYAQNWGNTSSATFDITGMQLEVGEMATPFEHESYGDNLNRCKRYYIRYSGSGNYAIGAAEDTTRGIFSFPAPDMRAAPTGTQGTLTLGGGIGSPPAVTAISSTTNSGHGLDVLLTVSSGLTTAHALRIRATDTASYLAFDAEL